MDCLTVANICSSLTSVHLPSWVKMTSEVFWAEVQELAPTTATPLLSLVLMGAAVWIQSASRGLERLHGDISFRKEGKLPVTKSMHATPLLCASLGVKYFFSSVLQIKVSHSAVMPFHYFQLSPILTQTVQQERLSICKRDISIFTFYDFTRKRKRHRVQGWARTKSWIFKTFQSGFTPHPTPPSWLCI